LPGHRGEEHESLHVKSPFPLLVKRLEALAVYEGHAEFFPLFLERAEAFFFFFMSVEELSLSTSEESTVGFFGWRSFLCPFFPSFAEEDEQSFPAFAQQVPKTPDFLDRVIVKSVSALSLPPFLTPRKRLSGTLSERTLRPFS